MATRYSGRATIRLEYRDDGRRMYATTVSVPSLPPWIGEVPAWRLGEAYRHKETSTEAYDLAAALACEAAIYQRIDLDGVFEVEGDVYKVKGYKVIKRGRARGGPLAGAAVGLIRTTSTGTHVAEVAEDRGAYKRGEVVHLGPGEFVDDEPTNPGRGPEGE